MKGEITVGMIDCMTTPELEQFLNSHASLMACKNALESALEELKASRPYLKEAIVFGSQIENHDGAIKTAESALAAFESSQKP